MGIAAAIIAALGAISAALGVVTILDVTPEAIFSNKLTWPFWMAIAVVLINRVAFRKQIPISNCPPGFKDQPQVVNGFSELMLDVFGRDRGLGARSAVGVASLPSHVAVEVEAVFEIAP